MSNIIYEAQKRAFSKRHITKNFIQSKLNRSAGTITITVQKALHKRIIRNIAVDAYLMLGINRIKYCIMENNSYNLLIRISSINMLSTVEKISSSVTLEELASKTDLSIKEISTLLEESQIPILMKEGELCLSRESAKALVSNMYNQKRDAVLAGIFNDDEGTSFLLEEEPSSEVQPVALSEKQNALPQDGSYYDRNMQLPSSFDIMKNRKRLPDISTGLKICLESLPGGTSKEGFDFYISEIVGKTARSQKFLQVVAELFPKKKLHVVLKDLQTAAAKYWSEANV